MKKVLLKEQQMNETRTHFAPEEIWDIPLTGWHLESGAPAVSCYTLNCDNECHSNYDEQVTLAEMD